MKKRIRNTAIVICVLTACLFISINDGKAIWLQLWEEGNKTEYVANALSNELDAFGTSSVGEKEIAIYAEAYNKFPNEFSQTAISHLQNAGANLNGNSPSVSSPTPKPTKHEHSYKEEVTKQPTCIEEGELVSKCSCGDSRTQTLPALGHDYQIVDTVEPKCEVEGYTEYKCSRCEDIYREPIPALEHKWELESQTDATCTEDGKIVYKCLNCNETKEEVIEAKGHSPSEWEVTKEAGFFTKGEKQKVCTICNEVLEVEIIPAKQDYRIWLIGGIVVVAIGIIVTILLVKKKKKDE